MASDVCITLRDIFRVAYLVRLATARVGKNGTIFSVSMKAETETLGGRVLAQDHIVTGRRD